MRITKKMLFNVSWEILWLCIMIIPLIAFLIYNTKDGTTYKTIAEIMQQEIGWLSNNNVIYNVFNSIFSSTSDTFASVEINANILYIFTWIITISLARFFTTLIVIVLRWCENLVERFAKVGGSNENI